MSKLIRALIIGIVSISTATVGVACIFIAVAWWNGTLTKDKLQRITEVVYNFDAEREAAVLAKEKALAEPQPITLNEVKRFSEGAALDLQLREEEVRQQVRELHYLKEDLERRRIRYQEIKTEFETELQDMRAKAQAAGIRELRAILQNISPDAAKDRIMAMAKADQEKGIETAAAVFRGMSLDEKSAVFERFQAEEEQAVVDKIASLLASGDPEARLIDAANTKVEQVKKAR